MQNEKYTFFEVNKTPASAYKNQQLSVVYSYSISPFPAFYQLTTVPPPCYPVLITRGHQLPNSDLLPALLYKINENQLALEAAIMELSNWVEQQGCSEVADNVRGALDTIDENEEFIKLTLAVMMTPE